MNITIALIISTIVHIGVFIVTYEKTVLVPETSEKQLLIVTPYIDDNSKTEGPDDGEGIKAETLKQIFGDGLEPIFDETIECTEEDNLR